MSDSKHAAGNVEFRNLRTNQTVSSSGTVEAEGRWLVSGSPDLLSRIELILGRCAKRAGENLFVEFGNTVGMFDLPGFGRLEVVSGKWDRQDYDHMLRELTAIAGTLPFAFADGGALPYDRTLSQVEPVLYHLLVWLRHILDEDAPPEDALLPALETILRDPHRLFERSRIRVRPEAAQRFDARTFETMFSSSCGWERSAGAAGPASLRGRFPSEIDVPKVVDTHDTPENRFVKCFLESVTAILQQAEISSRDDEKALSLAEECVRLRRSVEGILRRSFWRDVGPMIHFPASSTVLQKRRGYREVLRAFIRLRLAARIPFSRELVRRLLEVKRIDELYELWCFLKTAEILQDILGKPTAAIEETVRSDARQSDIGWGARVVWPRGVELHYNRHIGPRPDLDDPMSTWSLPLRPDLLLKISQGHRCGLYVFDAKFKLKIRGNGSERSFKSEDIAKMHAYRDAVRGVRSAWVLYPGSRTEHFSSTEGELDGVGAIPLIPGQDPVHLGRLLAMLHED